MKTGPKFKICRRLGDRVFGKCQTTKFTISGTEKKRKTSKHPKGQPSEYGLQLLEKQKAKYTYGTTEKQFRNYVDKVKKVKGSNHSVDLYKELESRADNVVFRMGIANTRSLARQLVSHGHILINGKKTRVPSAKIKIKDVIKIRPESRNKTVFKDLTDKAKNYSVPEWLSFDFEKSEGVVRGIPLMGKTESIIDFSSILEFYSR